MVEPFQIDPVPFLTVSTTPGRISFSFQLKLPANDMNFDAQEIQNIYLNLPYSDFYGDTMINADNIQFTILLSQLNENIVDADTTINATDFSATT